MQLSDEFICIREATIQDLDELIAIEQLCFDSDKLSKRSFRHHIQSEHSDLLIVENLTDTVFPNVLAYGLILRHQGTRLARLYSLAVLPEVRGYGLAQKLITSLEKIAVKRGRFYMRLEVAKNNHAAIKLYETSGYRVFGEYSDYYEDHSDALFPVKPATRVL